MNVVLSRYDKETLNNIKNYIKDPRLNQAIMINGIWGCGKTHFIKNVLKNNIEGKRIIYISLYGLNSIEQLNNRINSKILSYNKKSKKDDISSKDDGKIKLKRTNGINKIIDGIKTTGEIAANVFNIDLSKLFIGDFFELKNYVFIFDDLERCNSIDIVDLLGNINNLVEHCKTKAIIIGDETQIGLSDEKPSSDSGQKKNRKEIYDKTKEKLVSHTIKYEPDIIMMYESIVKEKIKSRKTSNFLIEHKENVYDIIKKTKLLNLRVLIFSIICFENIHNVIMKNKDIYNYPVLEEILKYCIYQSVKIKTDLIKSDMFFLSQPIAFPFVESYINDLELDNEAIFHQVESRVNHYKRLKKNKSLSKLYYWKQYEDDELIESLEFVIKQIEKNDLSFDEYARILYFSSELKYYGFKDIDLDDIYNKMKDNINKEGRAIDFYGLMISEEDKEVKEIFKPYLDQIKNLSDDINRKQKIEKIMSLINSDDWSDRFYTHCVEEYCSNKLQKEFFALIDSEELFKKISSAKTVDIYNLFYTIDKVYSFSNIEEFYKSDIYNLESFLCKVKELDVSKSITKKAALKQLVELLRTTLERLKK